jgi:4-hydroxy-tetrahydrodipicolinate synthase
MVERVAVMICPHSGVRTDEDLLRYFEAVYARIGDVPTVLQDFPARPNITRMRAELSRPAQILTGNNCQFIVQEMERGADGPMAGFSYPEMLSGLYDLMTAGQRCAAHDLFNRYLPLLKHKAQGQRSIALRKELMRRRGALSSNALRGPEPKLTQTDLAKLDVLIGRMDLPQG